MPLSPLHRAGEDGLDILVAHQSLGVEGSVQSPAHDPGLAQCVDGTPGPMRLNETGPRDIREEGTRNFDSRREPIVRGHEVQSAGERYRKVGKVTGASFGGRSDVRRSALAVNRANR